MPIDLTHKNLVLNGSKSQPFKECTILQDLLVCNFSAVILKCYDDAFAQNSKNLPKFFEKSEHSENL